jgi:uncharacterized protein (DUF1697 family)
MPAYIAMLRGINVSGHNTIKMEDLRALCSGLDFRSVETYVQSGNIVFQTTIENPSYLSKRISETILKSFGFDVSVIVRTPKEMRNVIVNNPFVKERDVDSTKLHVTFLSEIAQKSSLKKLEALSTSPDRFYAALHEIYLHCPGGYGRTKLSNTAIEKALSVRATTRNWKTTNTLFEMVSIINPR